MGHDDGGEAVGLVLPGLPGDRRLFEVRQVPGDAGGAGLQALQQRRRPGQRVAASTPRPLRRPGGHADRAVELGPAQRIVDDKAIGLAGREPLDGDLRRADVDRQIDSGRRGRPSRRRVSAYI